MAQRRIGNQAVLRSKASRAPAASPHRQNVLGVSPSGGDPLPAATRALMQSRFGEDFGHVRVHADSSSAHAAHALGAAAFTTGSDIYFARGRYRPESSDGRQLLAHELIHVVQQSRGGTTTAPSADIARHAEREADRIGATIAAASWPAHAPLVPPGGEMTPVARGTVQCQLLSAAPDAGTDAGMAPSAEDVDAWTSPSNTLLVVQHIGGVAILPARDIVYQPAAIDLAEIARVKPFVDRDLGPLLEVPSVGAAGTRIIRVGARTGFMLDSGADTRGVRSVVYLAEFQAALANVGVTDVSQVRILHVHADHVNRIVDVLRASPGTRVVVPRAYLTGTVHDALRSALAAVRADPAFGPTWNPIVIARDRGGPNLARFRYSQGPVVIEQVALRSALEAFTEAPSQDARSRLADAASFLTRLTNTTNKFSIIVLGDLRMEHLARFRTEMEAERVGSWNEFFAGATTLSGFSHHSGAFGTDDVTGLLQLLDVTMFRTGRLRVVEQTNRRNAPSPELRARADTIEFMQRLGVELVYTDKPANPPSGGTVAPDAPSGAGASRDTLTTRGPNAVATPVIASEFTAGVARLRSLVEAGETLRLWRPVAETHGAEAVAALDAEVAGIDASIAQLVPTLRTAANAMAEVRASGARTASGARDYTAAGGAPGQAFQASLSAIPATTPAETSLGPQGFAALDKLRAAPPSTIPLNIAVNAAMTRGIYSEVAFRYLLTQVDPATRESALYGPRGGRRPDLKAFERLRAQFGFQRAVLPDSGGLPYEPMAVGGTWSRGKVGTARGASWLLLFVEAVNVATEIKTTVETHQAINLSQNVLPTFRRVLFWQQLGVTPALVGVEDPWYGSATRESDVATVVKGLGENRWDGLYIPSEPGRPPITDADVVVFGTRLTYAVRNYDEYATLFHDSGQDAVRSVDGAGPGGWPAARWEVNTGKYEESGFNHVQDGIWVEVPRLTELMRTMTRRIIANTESGLERMGSGTAPRESAMDSSIGGFAAVQPPAGARRLQYRTAPETATVRVDDGSDEGLERKIRWMTPPVFYLHGVHDGVATVSGADFNTYSAIRTLWTIKRYDSVIHSPDTVPVLSEVTGNVKATIMVPYADLVPIGAR